MNNQPGCERYESLIAGFFEGTASDDAVAKLREHARTCGDCSMLLTMHKHLKGASLQELEAAVPDSLVESMWQRVETDITKDEWHRAGERRRIPVWRWVVAAQAAAIIVLAAGATLMFDKLNRIQRHETSLAERVAVQEQQLDNLEQWTTGDRTRVAAYSGGDPAWQRWLSSAGNVTVAEAVQFLERLPGNTVVLDAYGANRLMKQLHYTAPGGGSARRSIRTDDGLQADEALRLIAALDLDPSQRFPAGRITGLARNYD